jgi:hypothetical protein
LHQRPSGIDPKKEDLKKESEKVSVKGIGVTEYVPLRSEGGLYSETRDVIYNPEAQRAKQEVEVVALDFMMEYARQKDWTPEDVHEENSGYDIVSRREDTCQRAKRTISRIYSGVRILSLRRTRENLEALETRNEPHGQASQECLAHYRPFGAFKTYVKRYVEPYKVEVGGKIEEDWPTPYCSSTRRSLRCSSC